MSFFQKWLYGVDPEETQAELDRTNAALAVENQKDYAPGGAVYNRIEAERGTAAANDTYDEVEQRQLDQYIDVQSEVGKAFDEGLQEGYQNVTGGISKALKAPFQFAWASIPWQVWLAGAAVLFFYVGGGPWLIRKLTKVFK